MNIEFEKEVSEAMQITWETISYDFLEMIYVTTGNESASREDVIEIVLDADRVVMHGDMYEETAKRFKELQLDEKYRIANETFTEDRYGY